MLSGGNFHGEYISKILDYICLTLHDIGTLSERRIERLVNPSLNFMPQYPFLTKNGGSNLLIYLINFFNNFLNIFRSK